MIYHLQATLATFRRIMQQLSHDKRTLGLIFVVPCLLLLLLRWLYDQNLDIFDRIAPQLLGIFPFTIMFLLTSITTLRERTSGTLERLMTTPMAKLDVLGGYALAFGLLACLQALIASALLLFGLGLSVDGPGWFVVEIAVADALLGTALGLCVSALAQTEFQAVQFMPVVIFPQFLICGLLVPLNGMPNLLEKIAYALPLTYAVDALQKVASQTTIDGAMWQDLWVVGCYALAAIVLGAMTLRRQ